MIHVSASGLATAMTCPAACVLPRTPIINDAASRGTALHAFVAKAQTEGRERALQSVAAEHVSAAEALPLERLPLATNLRAEVAFAWNWARRRGRELGVDIGREYEKAGWHPETEIPGSADLCGYDDERIYVWDLKTGWKDVAPARHNRQLQLLAVALASATGKREARLGILYARGATIQRDEADLDAIDLAEAEDRIAEAMERAKKAEADVAQGKMPRTVAGAHCAHCASLKHCPAMTGLALRMAGNALAVTDEMRQALTPERATAAYHRWKQATAMLADVGRALHAYAEQTPIHVTDGVVFGPVVSGRDSLEGDIVHAHLERTFGRKVAEMAVTREATKKGIRAALREVAVERSERIGALEKKTYGELRGLGAITRKESVKVKEHKTGEENEEDE